MRVLVAAGVLLGLSVAGASAQSFDCNRARLDAEVAICDSPRLARLDEEMSSLYFGLPRYVREEIKGSQRRWLRQRNACGYDEDCIARAYLRRIDALSGY